jgi:hypothetical protein
MVEEISSPSSVNRLEAVSRCRDDGPGQTASRAVTLGDHANLDWSASSSTDPIRWRPMRRPRTEASTRQQVKHEG